MFRCNVSLARDARHLAAKGACSLGVPGVTPGLNGEVVGSSDHGNRNLASSVSEAVA